MKTLTLIAATVGLAVNCHLLGETPESKASPRDLALVEKIGTDGAKNLDGVAYYRLRKDFRELSISNPPLTKSFTKDLILGMPYFKDKQEMASIFDKSPEFNLTVLLCLTQLQNDIPIETCDVVDLGGQAAGLSNHINDRNLVAKLAELVKCIIKADEELRKEIAKKMEDEK